MPHQRGTQCAPGLLDLARGTFAITPSTHRFTKLAWSLECLQVAHLQPSVPGALRALREHLLTLLKRLL